MNHAIRRLTRDDWASYRAIRLEALRDLPDAFVDSFEDAAARPDGYWQALFESHAVYYGAFDGGALQGVVHCRIDPGAKIAHKCWLYGMYVRDVGRGTGCSNALIDSVLKHAGNAGAIQVHLGVSGNNERARRFYERNGFAVYGVEPRGLCLGARFIDEVYMVKFLDGA